jgi:hypothetical protein
MSHTTLSVPGMNNPPGRYEVTVRVAGDGGYPPRPGGLRGRGRPGSIRHERQRHQRAHGTGDHLRGRRGRARPAVGGGRRPGRRGRRSRLRIGSGHPAGERPVPAVVRRLEEHRMPELVVAAVARDLDVSHAATTRGSLPGRPAEARCPAHLRLAGPQLVTKRARFRLIIEQRNGHPNDHGLTGCHESTIIVTCTEDRCPEPGPCGVTAHRVGALYSRVPQRLRPSPWLNCGGAEGDPKELTAAPPQSSPATAPAPTPCRSCDRRQGAPGHGTGSHSLSAARSPMIRAEQ